MNKGSERALIKELVKRHNRGDIFLDEEEADALAMRAYQYGLNFEVQSKWLQKGLFDAADMAAGTLLPNEWRPYSGGQSLYGETTADKMAGTFGSVVGLGTGVGLGIKGARALYGSFATGGKAASAIASVKEAESIKRATAYAQNIYNKGRNIINDPFGMEKAIWGSGPLNLRLSPVKYGQSLKDLPPLNLSI